MTQAKFMILLKKYTIKYKNEIGFDDVNITWNPNHNLNWDMPHVTLVVTFTFDNKKLPTMFFVDYIPHCNVTLNKYNLVLVEKIQKILNKDPDIEKLYFR